MRKAFLLVSFILVVILAATSIVSASLEVQLSGQLTLPSSVYDAQVIGKLAYLANAGRGLRIIDVSDPGNPQEIGFLDIAGNDMRGLYILGDYAYIANASKGLLIVDITSPANPEAIGVCNAYGFAYDVHVAGGYAYLAADTNGLQVIDVSDPEKPKRVGFYIISERALGVRVIGDYAYVSTSKGLTIVDVSNPRHPRKVGDYNLSGSTHRRIQIVGNRAYIASGTAGIHILDISDPASVSYVSHDTPDNAQDVYATGGYAYVADSLEGLRIIDVSDPINPIEVEDFVVPKNQRSVFAIGGYVYLAGDDGLYIFRAFVPGTFTVQVTPPSLPANGISNANVTAIVADNAGNPKSGLNVNMSIVDGKGTIGGVKDNGDGTYTAIYTASNQPGVETVVVVVAGAPKTENIPLTRLAGHLPPRTDLTIDYMGAYDSTTTVYDVQLIGNYAYLAVGANGLRILDVSDPENPEEIGVLDVTGNDARGIHVVGDFAYMASASKGLLVINIADLANPELVGSYDTEGFAYGVYVSGQYAYVADDTRGLQVFDVSNPANPQNVGFALTAERAQGVQVVGDLAYVADSGKGLCVVDISDPRHPRIVSSFDPGGSSRGIQVIGDRAYLAASTAGIYVIDISNPAEPGLMGNHNTPGDAQDVFVSRGYGFVSSLTEGLRIIDISNPASMVEVENIVPYDNQRSVYVSGGYVYSGGDDSFYIFKLKQFVEGTLTVRISPSVLPADGKSTAVATATPRDNFGSPLVGESVNMFVTIGQGTIGPVKDNKDGTYTAIYTASSKAGIETITAIALGMLRTADITLTEIGAQTERKLDIPDAVASPGDTVIIPMNISDAAGVAGVDITLEYNEDILTALDVTTTALSNGMNLVKNLGNPGEIIISMARADGISGGSGALVNLSFKVSDKVTSGVETDITFESHELYDINGVLIPSISDPGTITIGSGCVKGDVNVDGRINSADAVLTLRIATKLLSPSPAQECAADVNSDGKINSADAIRILRIAAGLAEPGTDIAINNGGPINLSLTETYGTAGDRIKVPLKVDKASVLAGGDIVITYDASILRAAKVLHDSDVLMATNISEPGIVRMSFALTGILGSETLADIEFQVLADGISPIKLNLMELYDSQLNLLNCRFTEGKFKSWTMPAEHSMLMQNFPNPFNPETWMPYQLEEDSDVVIRIYSSIGELVRELNLGHKTAGYYITSGRAAYWDGKDKFGSEVSSGVYFYSIQANGFSAVKKMIIVK